MIVYLVTEALPPVLPSLYSTLDSALRAAAQAGGAGGRDAQSGIPPSLILMANQLEGLRERLSVHAAAHNIKVRQRYNCREVHP
jgi:hypothetical protein